LLRVGKRRLDVSGSEVKAEEYLSVVYESTHRARKSASALYRLFVSIVERRETAILACVVAVFQLANILMGRRASFAQRDFSSYYVWGVALRRHINPYTANLDPLARELGVFIKAGAKANYPPTFVLLWEPWHFLDQ
jgi:hypothetical protein